jgi:hypothetical protein
MFVVDFDKVNIRELLQVCHKWAGDAVKRSVRLAASREVNMCDSIGILQPGIAGEAIQHQCQALITFHITWTFKVFIKNSTNNIARRWDKTRRSDLIGKFPADQSIIISEMNINFNK